MSDVPDKAVRRVLERYAAAQLDERMKTLLLKLRKGADATLSMRQLVKVLALLGGWRVEPSVGLRKEHGGGRPDGDILDGNENEATARADHARLERLVVNAPPDKGTLGREYIVDLTPIEHATISGREVWRFKYKAWSSVEALRFTDPQGKTFEIIPGKHDHVGDPMQMRPYHVLPWLKEHTTYLAQISELLGLEPHEKAAPRTRENTGTCGACLRNIKLVHRPDLPTMALHGYNRPGHGYVIGRCLGGAHPPYERSPAGTKIMQEYLEQRMDALSKRIAHLRVAEEFQSGSGRTCRKGEPLFERNREKVVDAAQRDLVSTTNERNIYKWLVEHWEDRPLPKEGDKHFDWYTAAARQAAKV